MKQINVRLTSETNQQLRWLASKRWSASDALRQGLLLGSTLSAPDPAPAPYIHSRTLWLTDRELMILRSHEVSQSEAVRQAVSVSYHFYLKVYALKEVAA